VPWQRSSTGSGPIGGTASSRKGGVPIKRVEMTMALIAGGAKVVLAAAWIIALGVVGRVRSPRR